MQQKAGAFRWGAAHGRGRQGTEDGGHVCQRAATSLPTSPPDSFWSSQPACKLDFSFLSDPLHHCLHPVLSAFLPHRWEGKREEDYHFMEGGRRGDPIFPHPVILSFCLSVPEKWEDITNRVQKKSKKRKEKVTVVKKTSVTMLLFWQQAHVCVRVKNKRNTLINS